MELTCIVCPLGCRIKAEKEGDGYKITGNTCIRGEKYAISEITDPVRTLTSTMRTDSGDLVPVKTSSPIPKDMQFRCMEVINADIAPMPIKAGDVLIRNIAGLGSDIIATGDCG